LNHFADSLEGIDRAAFLLINSRLRHVLLDILMPFVSEKWNFVVPMALVALYLLVKGGRQGRGVVVCAVLLVLTADGSATAARNHFQRVRPCQALQGVQLLVGCSESFSFPSNHATNSFALAAFFAVSYRRFAVPLFVLAALVGYSRIYVGVHYPGDVLAGALLGTLAGLAAASGSLALGKRSLE
jgi:undecaprenyl-diphosphatase